MKITENISDLVLELTELETPASAKQVLNNDGLSLKHLIDLYSETNSERAKEVVLQIIDEVDGEWGVQLSDVALETDELVETVQVAEEAESLLANARNGFKRLSEDDFLDLLPVNCYMH